VQNKHSRKSEYKETKIKEEKEGLKSISKGVSLSIKVHKGKGKSVDDPECLYIVISKNTISAFTADEILEISNELSSICARIIQHRALSKIEYEKVLPKKDSVCSACGDWNNGKEYWWKEKIRSGRLLCDWCRKRKGNDNK
jgi:hypothetical protein